MNTALDLQSRLECDPIEKISLKIREDVHTQPVEVNNERGGLAEDQVFFDTDDVEWPAEKQPWQHKQDKPNTLHIELPVLTVSQRLKNDKCTNTFLHKMEPFSKVSPILIEQNADPVVFNFRRQMSGLLSDEKT